MTTGPAVAAFIEDARRRNLRPGTITQKRYALGRLARWLHAPLLEATHEDLTAYLDRLDKPESRATELSHLRSFYRWAVVEGLLTVDPTARLIRPRVPRRLPRPMPDGDLAVALDLAPERIRPWLLLAAYAGLRACEVAPLRAEDLLWANDPPLILVGEGKGGHMGAVPMAPLLADELRALPSRGWLFTYRDGRPGHVPPHLVSSRANRYLRDLGITHTFHTLRHWFGTQTLRANGGDLRQSQELMRHQSPVSTAIYTWVDPKAAAVTVGALPVLTR